MPMTEEEYQGNLEIQFLMLNRVIPKLLRVENWDAFNEVLAELREVCEADVYVEVRTMAKARMSKALGLDP